MHHPSTDDQESGDDLVHVSGPTPDEYRIRNMNLDSTLMVSNETSQASGSSTSPHVSLFSSGVPAAITLQHHVLSSGTPRPHAPTASSSNSSRPLSVLPNTPTMTKRTARFTTHDTRPQPPIVQLHSQIPSAQKAVDDPTTPVDSRRSGDAARHEYNTHTTLNQLFAGDAAMSNSRTPSYNEAAGPLYLRASEATTLPDHLYTRGLLEGRHSDITVIAFNKEYHLHRLILDRAPFFTTALSEPWIESRSKEVTLHPEDLDSTITQVAFELAIKKLYGCDISKECDAEALGLFATACWLEMQDLVDASIESILRQMSPDKLGDMIRLVTFNYYGRSGDRILESAKAMLSRNGWEMPLKYWDGMPGDIIRELVASDGFFVESEWDRWVLAKRLLDRRLKHAAIDAGLIKRGMKPIPKAPDSLRLMAVRFDAVYRQNSLTVSQPLTDSNSHWLSLYTNSDIERILVLLDEGIHYIHLDYEQLEYIRNARDIFGLPVLPEKVISNALWQQLGLRQKVLNTPDSAQELGLCMTPPSPAISTPNRTDISKGKEKADDGVTDEEDEEEEEMESGSWDGNGRPRKFWIPTSDCNIVLGNGADPVVTTSSTFQRHANRLSATIQPEDAQWATDFASSPSTMANPHTRSDYPARPISAGGSNAGQPKPMAYTEYPPFRFSAEFPNPRFLKEKKRVYSRTVSYAGSLWNIYIQKVRSAKSVQLGVYLHRAKEREADEQASSLGQQNATSADVRIGQLERDLSVRSECRNRRRSSRMPAAEATGEDTSGSGGDADGNSTSTNSRTPIFSTSTVIGRRRSGANLTSFSRPLASRALSSSLQHGEDCVAHNGERVDGLYPQTTYSPSDNESDTSSGEDEMPAAYTNPSLLHLSPRKSNVLASTIPPYVDGRPTIKTYFKIYSPSKGGRMLSIYESAPDRFNFSQSWGWKSSTLMLDEGTMNGSKDEETMSSETLAQKRRSGEGKLRFMVVIGNL